MLLLFRAQMGPQVVARVSSGGAAQALALIGAGYLTRTMLACGMLRSGPVRSGIGFLD